TGRDRQGGQPGDVERAHVRLGKREVGVEHHLEGGRGAERSGRDQDVDRLERAGGVLAALGAPVRGAGAVPAGAWAGGRWRCICWSAGKSPPAMSFSRSTSPYSSGRSRRS